MLLGWVELYSLELPLEQNYWVLAPTTIKAKKKKGAVSWAQIWGLGRCVMKATYFDNDFPFEAGPLKSKNSMIVMNSINIGNKKGNIITA